MDINDFIRQNNNSINKTIRKLNKRTVRIEDDHGAKEFYFICKNCGLIECSDTVYIFELEMHIPEEIQQYLGSY